MSRPLFAGSTYCSVLDQGRLTSQLAKVRALMSDARWRTLRQISDAVGGSEAGVSARLRDMRKAAHGSMIVERERVEGGLYRYRVVPPRDTGQLRLLLTPED